MFLISDKKIIFVIDKAVIYDYNGVKVFYQKKGSGMVNIFLHGWGQTGQSFDKVIEQSEQKCWLKIDLPPFGKSGQIDGWTIFTYANLVISLCEHLGIDSCNLIGHSFGGRVAIVVCAMKGELVNKLVLVSSAGMKPKRKINYYYKVFTYKTLKFLGFSPLKAGSSDYSALDQKMKPIFVSIVSTHLEEYCPNIKVPTLIVFGENDTQTPLYMARRLNKLIKNSKLVVLKHAGHFCYEERLFEFSFHLESFLKEGS